MNGSFFHNNHYIDQW